MKKEDGDFNFPVVVFVVLMFDFAVTVLFVCSSICCLNESRVNYTPTFANNLRMLKAHEALSVLASVSIFAEVNDRNRMRALDPEH